MIWDWKFTLNSIREGQKQRFFRMCAEFHLHKSCPDLFQYQVGGEGGLVTPTFFFTDLLVRLSWAHTQNFSLLGPFLHLNFGGVILVILVILVTGGKQSQLLLRPTKVGSGLQVWSGVWQKYHLVHKKWWIKKSL